MYDCVEYYQCYVVIQVVEGIGWMVEEEYVVQIQYEVGYCYW